MRKCNLFLCMMMATAAMAQQTIPLYPGTIPNSKPTPDEEVTTNEGMTIVRNISRPSLSIFLPAKEKANGTAIIIFPGGGYWVNAIGHEGYDVAKKFTAMGITAFVVKYRIPNDATMMDREIGPLQDAQQAIHVVRTRAKEWSINPSQIGVMGFSAGGHLASTAGTHFTKPVIVEPGVVNVRPDFMILIYPVISFQDHVGHTGSRDQLIGKSPLKDKIDFYSNELQVTAQTPPTFLVHASDDDAVKSENSILFYQALVKYHVPAELHIYQKGGHGFGMNNKSTSDQWMDRCTNWLRVNDWIK
ncbi:MAG: alpha/beta hydrolase [Cyclobacteriaceae bacterium]|nr:alpha/beta hydrolase [Cyclobacteriaceae bacterium]